jgi:hypothetical protein
MAGLDWLRKFWQRLWDRDSAAPFDGITRLHMYYGSRFGKLAHSLYPGGAASWSWVRMPESDVPRVRRQLADALRSYCKRDTEALVALLAFVSHSRVTGPRRAR